MRESTNADMTLSSRRSRRPGARLAEQSSKLNTAIIFYLISCIGRYIGKRYLQVQCVQSYRRGLQRPFKPRLNPVWTSAGLQLVRHADIVARRYSSTVTGVSQAPTKDSKVMAPLPPLDFMQCRAFRA
jgi:hypothetical protein